MVDRYKINIGDKFGKWTIVSNPFPIGKYYKVECLCLCGTKKLVYKHSLTSGKSTTCGCSHKEDRTFHKPRKDIKPDGGSGFSYYYSTYKRNAKIRNLIFKLSKEEFKVITKTKCVYCGREPSNKVKYHGKKHNSYYICNGVDRVDNNIGYIISNCVPCCKICNRAKSTLTLDEFKNWMGDVVNFHSPKGSKKCYL